MKVLERGQVPEERVYKARCMRCKSLLEFQRHEARFTPCQKDGDFLTVTCPVCGAEVNKDA